jgi:hypothetical protein
MTTHADETTADETTTEKPQETLNDIIKLWQKLHRTPTQHYVLNILTTLNQRALESLPTFKVKCSTFPTAAHLVHDIFADTEVHYRSSLTGADEGNMTVFFAGWNALEQNPGADINNRIQVPYSAWGVKASPNGLQDCNFQLPEVLLQPTTFVSPVGNGHKLLLEDRKDWPLFHSILTPAGNVTDIHDDGVLSASLLVQVYGTKVLFTWPGSEANREYFRDSHGTAHHLRLGDAISKMTDGFKVTILNPLDAVKMEPGMIHAVVSPTNSAIGCWEYVNTTWLDSDDIRAGAEWALGLIKSRERPLLSDEMPENMYKGLVYGMNMWRCLLQNLVDTSHEGAELVQVVQIRRLLEWLERQIPAEYMGECEVSSSDSTKKRGRKKRKT